MKSLTLATALATAVACLVTAAPAQADSTPSGAAEPPVLNVCAELDLDPCPEGLDAVEASDVERTAAAQAGCDVIFSTYGPGVYWETDPIWGTWSIRYLFIGSGVVCDTRQDLTAVAETVPTERTTNESVLVDQDVCLSSKSCWATAGWGHSDFLVGHTPICAYSSATATINTRAFGPYHPPSSTAGVNCM